MSHLHFINVYKEDLIKAGVTNPVTQIALTRTAYTCAFIRLFTQLGVNAEDRQSIMSTILSEWNEITPVNGNQVIATVLSFYQKLYSEMATAKGNIFVTISNEQVVTDNPTFNDYPSYEALVEYLITEAVRKYNRIKGV